jgi:hypothetical protein
MKLSKHLCSLSLFMGEGSGEGTIRGEAVFYF